MVRELNEFGAIAYLCVLMITDKISIRRLAAICVKKGIKHVVFSPGSRCAPLILAFEEYDEIHKYQIIDERSAAHFALGIAQQTKHTVALVCTSGTAVLNYSMAVAEAYYQRIPLLLLTADRPKEWVDQLDMQTINQTNVFSNYVKASYELKSSAQADDMWYNDRVSNEAINASLADAMGPVHLNIPMSEPLYRAAKHEEQGLPVVKIIDTMYPPKRLSTNQLNVLVEAYNQHPKVMLIIGLNHPDKQLTSLLDELVLHKDVLILTESTSNLHSTNFISEIDLLLESFGDDHYARFAPDLLISIGGFVVSKKIKTLFRTHRPKAHWHIDEGNQSPDTYQALTMMIAANPKELLTALLPLLPNKDIGYSKPFIQRLDHIKSLKEEYNKSIPFCDLKAYAIIAKHIPHPYLLQWGNSTPVRYSCLVPLHADNVSYGNRGVGGIDGAMSTALGACVGSELPTLLVIGDLGFFHDNNALWNPYIHNLSFRIIVINNEGGNIFSIIDGPNALDNNIVEKYFTTHHKNSIADKAKSFDIEYTLALDESALDQALVDFFNDEVKPKILEVKTDGGVSSKALKELFRIIKLG